MRLQPRNVALTIIALGLAGLFVRLGFWQLSRRAERADLIEARAARASEPALDWTLGAGVPADTAGTTWRRVKVSGRYDREHEIVLRGRSFEGRPGVEVLTPLLVGDAAVLVVRGWLPAHDGLTPELTAGWPADRSDSPVVVEGRVIPPATGRAGQPLSVSSEGRDHLVLAGIDFEVIGERLPYPLRPFAIRLDRHLRDAAALEQPTAAEPDMGNHLSYAIQWFAFAAISIVGTGILLRKDART